MLCYVVFTLVSSAAVIGATPNAFGSYLINDLTDITPLETIVFDGVHCNTFESYSAYNASDGVFTAYSRGVFMFNYAIGYEGLGVLVVNLVHKNYTTSAEVVLSETVTQGLAEFDIVQSGNTVIVQLDAFDKVWLRLGAQSTGTVLIDGLLGESE